MKIETITLSIFELPSSTDQFALVEDIQGARRRWKRQSHSTRAGGFHVLRVRRGEGIEGLCTVGDARYTTTRREDLEQLPILVLGEDPLDRDHVNT